MNVVDELFLSNRKEMRQLGVFSQLLASSFHLACPTAVSLHDGSDAWGYCLPTILLEFLIDGKVGRERMGEMKETALDPGILPIRKTRSTSQ